MSNYYSPTKGVVNRYWKRPKPRVYECNIRDAERFYQQSYKDYLEAKEYAAKRAAEGRTGIGDDSSSGWGVRRSNSLFDTLSDRDASGYNNPSKSSFMNSRQYGDDSFSGSATFRGSSLTNSRNKTPDHDVEEFEERLQRIQKLKSELGLPSETAGEGSKVSFATPSSMTSTSSISTRQFTPDSREKRVRTVDMSSGSSYSTARASKRSGATDLTSDSYGDNSSRGNERSSRFSSKYSNNEDPYSIANSRSKQNGVAASYGRDDSDKYSFKSSMKSDRRFDLDDDSHSYKPSESKSSRKAVVIDDSDDYDADAFLSRMKKKIPSSDEILERIKKMDSDM